MPRKPRIPETEVPVQRVRGRGSENRRLPQSARRKMGDSRSVQSELKPAAKPRRRKPARADATVESMLASRTVDNPVRPPREFTLTSLYRLIGWIFLLPACVITTHAFAIGFGDSMGNSFWRTPAFWFFGMGMVLWIIAFLALPRPVLLYVWAHEMTHAIFVILCGGKVRHIDCTSEGGYVLTDKNNVLISLAPYFFPFYTVIVVPVCLLIGGAVDLTVRLPLPVVGDYGFRPLWAVFLLIGITWGFHMTFTIWMIGKDQPDLRINGVFFSLTLIYLVNALVLAFLLIVASPDVSLTQFSQTWGRLALEMAHAVEGVFLSLFRLGRAAMAG